MELNDNTLAHLEAFLQTAELNSPLDVSFTPFDDNDRLGSLLNRVVAIYSHLAKEQTSLTTAQEMAIRERQEQIRNKKQLTQNISHELKTPVSSILGYLETILSNPSMNDLQQREFVEKSYEQAQRLSHLLQDLSVITRMDEASEIIEKERVSLSEIIDETVREHISSAHEKGITIANLTPTGLHMMGNRALLQSVFHNLLENALLYSKGTQVGIQLLETPSSFFVFDFWDNGVGIAPEHLPRIFERFYRIDKGRSRKLGGTGLGLSIVKNAILLHGGRIEARCRPAGGLEFIFSLNASS